MYCDTHPSVVMYRGDFGMYCHECTSGVTVTSTGTNSTIGFYGDRPKSRAKKLVEARNKAEKEESVVFSKCERCGEAGSRDWPAIKGYHIADRFFACHSCHAFDQAAAKVRLEATDGELADAVYHRMQRNGGTDRMNLYLAEARKTLEVSITNDGIMTPSALSEALSEALSVMREKLDVAYATIDAQKRQLQEWARPSATKSAEAVTPKAYTPWDPYGDY